MEPIYVGWLLLDTCTGDTNRGKQETKEEKIIFWCYIYLFLFSILYIDTIVTFPTYIAILEIY